MGRIRFFLLILISCYFTFSPAITVSFFVAFVTLALAAVSVFVALVVAERLIDKEFRFVSAVGLDFGSRVLSQGECSLFLLAGSSPLLISLY